MFFREVDLLDFSDDINRPDYLTVLNTVIVDTSSSSSSSPFVHRQSTSPHHHQSTPSPPLKSLEAPLSQLRNDIFQHQNIQFRHQASSSQAVNYHVQPQFFSRQLLNTIVVGQQQQQQGEVRSLTFHISSRNQLTIYEVLTTTTTSTSLTPGHDGDSGDGNSVVQLFKSCKMIEIQLKNRDNAMENIIGNTVCFYGGACHDGDGSDDGSESSLTCCFLTTRQNLIRLRVSNTRGIEEFNHRHQPHQTNQINQAIQCFPLKHTMTQYCNVCFCLCFCVCVCLCMLLNCSESTRVLLTSPFHTKNENNLIFMNDQ